MMRLLGITTKELFGVRMRVVRRVMSGTRPDSPATISQSPTLKGSWSQKMVKPAMVLARESWAARPTARPATPRPARAAPTFTPQLAQGHHQAEDAEGVAVDAVDEHVHQLLMDAGVGRGWRVAGGG